MARVRWQDDSASVKDRIRDARLARLRERARTVAETVVRLPKDRAQIPHSSARAELLSAYGLTAATEAEYMDAAELVAQIACHAAFWYEQTGGREGTWICDEFYQASADEVRQIAREELAQARRITRW